MRNFFKDKLNNLYIYCGNRQLDKMSDPEITALLDALERVSKVYGYIPEEHQKQIIEKCLIEDKEYQNLNARLISKWLEVNGKVFFIQKHHEEKTQPENYKPLEGEERDRAINEYLGVLAKTTSELSYNQNKGSGSRLRENLDQHGIIQPPNKTLEESEAVKSKHAVRSFWIDDFEIYAKDQADAMRIFIENFGQPKDETITNEKRTEGTGEDSGLPISEGNTV